MEADNLNPARPWYLTLLSLGLLIFGALCGLALIVHPQHKPQAYFLSGIIIVSALMIFRGGSWGPRLAVAAFISNIHAWWYVAIGVLVFIITSLPGARIYLSANPVQAQKDYSQVRPIFYYVLWGVILLLLSPVIYVVCVLILGKLSGHI
ncbi:MAG TPA: hypothetical protein VGN12_27985 [Pirellulales bacterium]|jgi:hypothetical protein